MAVVVAETPAPCPWLSQLECLLLFESFRTQVVIGNENFLVTSISKVELHLVRLPGGIFPIMWQSSVPT